MQSVLLLNRCNLLGWGFGWCLIDEGTVDIFDLWIISNLGVWTCADKINHRRKSNHSGASYVPWLISNCTSSSDCSVASRIPWLNTTCMTSRSMTRNSHLLFFHVECDAIEISLGNLRPIHNGPANSFMVQTEELDIK